MITLKAWLFSAAFICVPAILNAFEVPKTPKSNLDPKDVRSLAEKSAQVQKQEAFSTKVKIGVNIKTFAKQGRNSQGRSVFTHDKAYKYSLRASLNEIQNFYITNWHIVSKPAKWNRTTGAYTTNLEFYRMYGEYKQLEESVATIELSGKLVKGQDAYVLVGSKAIRVRDKLNQPLFDIVAGYSGDPTAVNPLGVARK